MAAHSSILAWKIPWAAGPDEPWSMRLQRVEHSGATNTHTHTHTHTLNAQDFTNASVH